MAKYGLFRYGTRKYGLSGGAINRAYVFAQVVDFQKVLLTVETPTQVGQGFAIVRTRTGAAEDPSGGFIVTSGTIGGTIFTVEDGASSSVPVPPGMVYYTLFTFDTVGAWFKEAATSVVVPKDKGTMLFFKKALPGFYTSEEHNPIDPYLDDSDLMRFLYGFAMTYDELRTDVDLILPEARNLNVLRRMHDAFARGKGMPSEYTIGVGSTARLTRESGYIYRNKGTLSSIATYVEALTGWDTVAEDGSNLLLSLDDGSFEYSTGNWGASGGTISRLDIAGGITGPTMDYDDTIWPYSNFGVGVVTLSSTSCTITLPGDSSRLKAIPVTSGGSYVFSVPVKATTGTPSIVLKVTWLSMDGSTISTSTGSSASSTTSWTTETFTATAPAGASFAVLVIEVSGSSGDVVQIDRLMFTLGSDHYHDPRSVTVICKPNRVNLVFDPSLDHADAAWTAVTGTFSPGNSEHSLLAGKSGKAVGAPDFEFASNTTPVIGYYPFSLSAYAYSDAGTCEARIKWYDATDSLISTNTMSFGDITSWKRIDMTVVSPETAETAVITFAGTGTVWVDAVAFERTDRPQVFFCGNISDSIGQDSLWSGDDHNAYSLLYSGRISKMARLKATMPYYLPLGVTARVLLWNSQYPEVQALVPLGE